MESVYYLTIVLKGRVTLTSIIARGNNDARVQSRAEFVNLLSNSAWAINTDYSENNVTVWSLIPEEFKATLIKA